MACRQYLADYPNAAVILPWGMSVVFSCPVHQLLLELGQVGPKKITWPKDDPKSAPALVSMLDSRNYSAMLDDTVDLPGRIIGDEYWFQLVQAIFQELGHSIVDIHNAERWRWQQDVWNIAGYSPRGFGEWFEFDLRCAMLVATAIDQMERGRIIPTGTEGHMFSERKNDRWKAACSEQKSKPTAVNSTSEKSELDF